MDKQHVKGAIDKAKGTIKDSVGAATGNKKLRAEGKMDKAKGAVRTLVGDVKDGVRKIGK